MARRIRTLNNGQHESISILDETNGGTGQSTFTTGDVLYSSAANTLDKLGIGDDGYVLTVSGGVPVWAPPIRVSVGETVDVITLGRLDVLTANSTRYLLPNFAESLNNDFPGYLIDGYGEISTLRITMGTAPGVGEDVVFTVVINDVDTLITTTISGADTTGYNNAVAISVNPGDTVSLKAVSSTGSVAADVYTTIKYTEELESVSTGTIDIITVGKVGIVAVGATRYLLPNFAEATTEVFPGYVTEEDGYLENLYVYADTAPGLGEDIVITVRVNSVDTALTTTLSDTNNFAYDLSNIAAVLAGDRITIRSVTTGGMAAANLYVVCRYRK